MLILDRGVWVKFEYEGELKDGVIKHVFSRGCGPVGLGYEVFCNDYMSEVMRNTITISTDQIKFVKLNDLDGGTYYANYRLLNEYVDWQGKHVNPGTRFGKAYYNELCMHDAIRGNRVSYKANYCEAVTDPFAIMHYGVKRYSGANKRCYDENALKGAINKMYYGILTKDMNYNPLDYTKYNPKHVLLNGRYTTVVWEDGSHTVVKLAKGEEYDPEKAILYAIIKHMNGDVKAETDRYLDRFIEKTIYQSQSKKEFLKELDERDAAGDICQEYNPDEDETFFDDEEDSNDTE